jgi:NADH-quinone oxidoreductase subunit N
VTLLDLRIAAPLVVLGAGSILVLLLGPLLRGRYLYPVAFLVCVFAAAFAAAPPPAEYAPVLGLTATPFARFFTLLFAGGCGVTLLFSHGYCRRRGIGGEEYPATLLFAAFGMAALVAAANLLVLFLALESLTFAFYILTAADRRSAEGAEAGLKYLLNGATAAAFIAFGLSLIYAGTGSLDLDALSGSGALVTAGWGLLLAGFGFKVSLVPFHLWTPDVYQGAPPPVTGFLSTGSKGATFAAFLLLLRSGMPEAVNLALWWLCLASMVLGNLAALRQRDLRRLLAYSSVAQMGYVTLGLIAGRGEGHSAVIFYVAAYTAMNLAAFGALGSLSGEERLATLDDCRGLGYRRPFRAAVLAISMVALAGIPPTAGFAGKLAIFLAALQRGEVFLAVAGILSAAVSVYYYLGVVVSLYMRDPEALPADTAVSTAEGAALAAMALAVVIPGVWPAPLFDLAARLVSG